MPRSGPGMKQRGKRRTTAEGSLPPPPAAPQQRHVKSGAFTEGWKQAEEEAQEVDVAGLPKASLTLISPHPYNPPHRWQDADGLKELADDLRANGLLQPIIVVSRQAVVDAKPSFEDRIDASTTWVILAGHRRWGAARIAGLNDLPILVRNDLADPAEARKVFVRENVHRKALTIIEEAREYYGLLTGADEPGEDEHGLIDEELGKTEMTEREVAQEVSRSQAHIHKTWQLLRLPKVAQNAIETGSILAPDGATRRISANGARPLLKLPRERRLAVWKEAIHGDTEIQPAVNRALAAIEREEQEREVAGKLEQENTPLITPQNLFGDDHERHKLKDTEVDAAREKGQLAGAVIEAGHPVYYATEAVPQQATKATTSSKRVRATKASPTKESPDVSMESVEPQATAHEQAHVERTHAIRRLMKDITNLKPATILEILADGVLAAEIVSRHPGADEVKEWTGADIATVLVGDNDRPTIQRVAVASALAGLEFEAKQSRYNEAQPWPTPIGRYIQRLVDLGYHELSTHERQRLDS